jgi:hypothetical protein
VGEEVEEGHEVVDQKISECSAFVVVLEAHGKIKEFLKIFRRNKEKGVEKRKFYKTFKNLLWRVTTSSAPEKNPKFRNTPRPKTKKIKIKFPVLPISGKFPGPNIPANYLLEKFSKVKSEYELNASSTQQSLGKGKGPEKKSPETKKL